MTLEPLLLAPMVIKLHVAAVAITIALSPFQLALPKGTPLHRRMGWGWVTAMAGVCITGLFILDRPLPPHIGPVSWLHLFSIFTLVMLARAILAARRHDRERHRKIMRILVFFALGVPLIFALFIPGRILFAVLFRP